MECVYENRKKISMLNEKHIGLCEQQQNRKKSLVNEMYTMKNTVKRMSLLGEINIHVKNNEKKIFC